MRDKSAKDLAAALGVAVSTIRYQARLGALPHDETPGGHRRFDIDEVRATLATTRRVRAGLEPEGVDFGDPLAPSEDFAGFDSPNESAMFELAATAGGEVELADDETRLPEDPFEFYAVAGRVRYPQQAHGVGASA